MTETFADNPFEGIACRECGAETLRLETRTEIRAAPLGTYSIAGSTPKAVATTERVFVCVCGTCHAECRGTPC
jgi:ribosomal protein L40E